VLKEKKIFSESLEELEKLKHSYDDLKREKKQSDIKLRDLTRDAALIIGDSKNSREESI